MDIKVTTNTRDWDLGAFREALEEDFEHHGISSDGDSITVFVGEETTTETIGALRDFVLAYHPQAVQPAETVADALEQGDTARAVELLNQTVGQLQATIDQQQMLIDEQQAVIDALQAVGG